MKRLALTISLIFSFSLLFPLALAGQEHQQGCHFNIAGTWQSSTGGPAGSTRARFAANGVMTELSHNASGKGSEWQAAGKSRYMLDDPKAPKAMTISKIEKGSHLTVPTTLEIKTFDDGMFVTQSPGDRNRALTRWTRIDPYRYFVVLAAGKGDPAFGGPGFAMLIKTDGIHTQIDTFGTWPVVNPLERHAMIGVIPEEIRKQFDSEPANDSGSMLRLEVTAGPYNRALEVMKTWQRRVEEDQLLYPTIPYLENAVYLNLLTSSLNETNVLAWNEGTPCAETIKLQKLTWLLHDPIMSKHNLPQTPYYLFKTLRELNTSLHLNDTRFRAALTGDHSGAVAMNNSLLR